MSPVGGGVGLTALRIASHRIYIAVLPLPTLIGLEKLILFPILFKNRRSEERSQRELGGQRANASDASEC